MQRSVILTDRLGADHLTLEGGGGGGGGGAVGDFWSASFFFLATLVGSIFFSPPKCSAGYFFLSSFLCRIFFPQKSVVFTFTLWLLQ